MTIRAYLKRRARRVPLAKPRTCDNCREVVTDITRAQLRAWKDAREIVPRPYVIHHCGGVLQPDGPRATTLEDLTGGKA